ncbi:MAG: YeeE/YedE family protein [Chloroflexota bacterium]|nr:YeeE/YedE family protein [Chloroflexota bacterium]
MTVPAIATLLAGIVLGYLGQRSRMCFVGAIRDVLLVRDTYLFKGLIAFGLTTWLAFPLAGLLGGQTDAGPATFPISQLSAGSVMLAAVGGLGLGLFSTLANGCPFRQHVLAAQGALSSLTYLAGFYLGAVVFQMLVVPLLGQLL